MRSETETERERERERVRETERERERQCQCVLHSLWREPTHQPVSVEAQRVACAY